MGSFRIALFSFSVFLGTIFLSQALAQETMPGMGNKAVVVYSLETSQEKLQHIMYWSPFDPATGKYVGMDHKDQKKNRKRMEKFRGEEVYEGKRDGKKYKRVYVLVLDPGTYVLHSVAGKGSSTSFHPETFGFQVTAGEALFLGHFSVNQKNDAFRSLIDPNIGMSLDYLGSNFSNVSMDQNKLKKNDVADLANYVREVAPIYYEVKEYE